MQWLLDGFATAADQPAFIHEGEMTTYGEVVDRIDSFRLVLTREGIEAGEKVAVLADYAPAVVCLILALARHGAIVIPLSRAAVVEEDAALAISGCDWFVEFDPEGRQAPFARRPITAEHAPASEPVAPCLPALRLCAAG